MAISNGKEPASCSCDGYEIIAEYLTKGGYDFIVEARGKSPGQALKAFAPARRILREVYGVWDG
jgi:DNA-binding Lrp family transcriptional regulator